MKKLKLYLDNCCFNRPFDNQEQERIYLETEAKLFIQKKIKDGHYFLIWSFILDYENSVNPNLEAKISIQKWKDFSKEVIYLSPELLNCAKEIKEKGFGVKDSLHISSAIISKADCFLTVDKGILKKKELIKDIFILNPLEFIQMEEEL